MAGRVVNGDKYRRRRRQGRAHARLHRARHHPADENGNFAFTFKVTKTYKNYKVKWVRSSSATTRPQQRRDDHQGLLSH